ncbi:ComEC/Rec2 family competence protein [Ligaoa zhengdingensis]|uniref:ComEC/Rec2 family competence protein n=1 Tax=Ligaoa zhengdingensis TaxID=2763658 RepID=UPI0031BB9E2E
MKRPLAVIGITYLITAAAAACFSAPVLFGAGAVLLLAGLLSLAARHPQRRAAFAVLVTAALALLATGAELRFRVQPLRDLAGQTARIEGRVCAISGGRSIEIELEGGLTIAVSSRETLDVELGDRFSAVASLSRYDEGASTGYARSKAVLTPLRAFVAGDYTAVPCEPGSLRGMMGDLNRRMDATLHRLLPNESGDLLSAMLLGRKQLVPQESRDDFSAAGISHLLAISGLHLAVLAAFFGRACHALRIPTRLSALLTAVAVFGYMGLVGFPVSVCRAGGMVLLALLAQSLSRRADPITSLAAAGLILCAGSPLAASDVSFQLSFLATLGILLGANRLAGLAAGWVRQRRFPRLWGAAANALAVTVSATLFTLPVVVARFGRAALYAPLTNLMVSPLVPLALVCGLVAILLGMLPAVGVIASPFALAAGLSVGLIDSVAAAVASLPFAELPAGAGFVSLWMAGAALMVAMACVRPSRKKSAACAALCAITLMTGILSYQLAMRGATSLTVIATGRSTAAVVAVKDGHAAVLGAINSKSDVYEVEQALSRRMVDQIDLFALSPASGNRNGAVSDLLSLYPVDLAVVSAEDAEDERMLAALDRAGAAVLWADLDAQLWGGDRVSIDGNTICSDFSGIKSFILDGDCDILKVNERMGGCAVAVAASGAELSGLQCDLLVTRGDPLGGMPAGAVIRLDDARPRVELLCRAGRMAVREEGGGLW